MASGLRAHVDDPAARSGAEPVGLRQLALGFGLLAALTYGLIVLGALVRAHGAGLACPDWPLCFGQAVPEFDLKVAFEWTHRVVAGGIAFLFAGLAIAAARNPVAKRAVGRLVMIGAVLLGAQIVLGALTVWHLLASWTVTSHLITGNAFAVTLLLTQRALSEAWRPPPARPVPAPRVQVALVAAAMLLLVQMVLGGLVSSTFVGLACPDWPQCMDGVWFPTWSGPQGLHLVHRTNGYALLAALALCAWWGREEPSVARWLQVAVALVAAQIVVGVANVLLQIPVEVTGLHSALAAGLVGVVALTLREAFKRP